MMEVPQQPSTGELDVKRTGKAQPSPVAREDAGAAATITKLRKI